MLRDVVPIILATRALFVALTFATPLVRVLLGVSIPVSHVNGTGTILDVWNRWDTLWYDDLAKLGYNLHGPNDYKNVAFFPLYPLLTRTLHDVMAVVVRDGIGIVPADPTYPPYLVPGLIVANVCSIGALIFFYDFVRLDFGRAVARRAVTLFALFPPALFLAAAYSEGTYLLCAVACLYALRLERWWQAGFWGLLASAARPPGVLLVIPFLMAWAQAHPLVARSLQARLRLAGRAVLSRLRRIRLPRGTPRTAVPLGAAVGVPLLLDDRRRGLAERTPRRIAGDVTTLQIAARARLSALRRPRDWPEEVRLAARNVVPAVAIPLGLALFMYFLYRVFGNPLWFSSVQAAWWRTFAPPWETLFISVAWPLGDIIHGTVNFWDPSALHDDFYEIAGLVVTLLAWRRLPRVQGVYLWLLWLVLLSSPAMLPEQHTGEPHHDVMMSLPRMLLMFFPLFTFFGLQRRLYPWLVALFALALTVYTSVFLAGVWIS